MQLDAGLMQVPVPQPFISQSDIDSIMCSAIDNGGVNHWVRAIDIHSEPTTKDPACEGYLSEVISRGGSLEFFPQIEEWHSKRLILTRDMLLIGLGRWLLWTRRAAVKDGRIDPGQIDADAADSIVQFALFGEILYN